MLEYNRCIPRLYLCICYLYVVIFHLLQDSSPCFVILILILRNWFSNFFSFALATIFLTNIYFIAAISSYAILWWPLYEQGYLLK